MSTTAIAKARILPGSDSLKGIHSEMYRGNRLTVKRGKQWGTLESLINGQSVGHPYGSTNGRAVRELDSLRGTVDHFNASPESYTNGNGDVSFSMVAS